MASTELELFVATQDELNELLVGVRVGVPYPWPSHGAGRRVPPGRFGVLCERDAYNPDFVRPVLLVIHDEDERKLFARYSQLRGDLSPLSSWLNVVEPKQFERMEAPVVEADLGGFEAAWTGLIVAEASILSRRSQQRLKQSACMATQSFAIARHVALWGASSVPALRARYNTAQAIVRGNSNPTKVAEWLEPIWSTMLAVTGAGATSYRDDLLAFAIQRLHHARLNGQNEWDVILEALGKLKGNETQPDIARASPEQRLRIFDDYLFAIADAGQDLEHRIRMSFLAGYIATIAAGGAASLGLAEAVADEYPEVLAFAYLIGGLGERRSWAGAFQGLGRIVARELRRSWNVKDGPASDFSSQEAEVLVDRHLNDPLVYLKLKQSRIATVALAPGVYIQLPFAEFAEPIVDARRNAPTPQEKVDPLTALADALFPLLRDRFEKSSTASSEKKRSYRKSKQQELKM